MTLNKIPLLYNRNVRALCQWRLPRKGIPFYEDQIDAIWELIQASGTGSIALDTSHVLSGSQSLKLHADPSSTVHALKFLPFVHTVVGFEVNLGINATLWANGSLLNVVMPLENEPLFGTNKRLTPEIRYGFSSQKWQYRDSTGTFQDLVTGMPLGHTSDDARGVVWNNIKLVVDFKKKEYLYAIIYHKLIDMRGIPLQNNQSNYEYVNIHPEVVLTTNANLGGADVYIDNVILTIEDGKLPSMVEL